MGTDYQARKAAKKNRRRESHAPVRQRKKKGPRRLCRGVCYADPMLQAADHLEMQHDQQAQQPGELAAYAQLTFGKAEKGSKRDADAASIDGAVEGDAGKKRRLTLSTGVNLLDATTANTTTPRKKQLPLAAISEAMKQLPELMQRFMAGQGLAEPMAIQTRCWPLLLAGRDVQAVAEPGSGKTLAYMLPGAVLLCKGGHNANTKPEGPLALILLPTRELAQQVASACRELRKYSGLRTICITGGTDKEQQVEALSKQPHILVATPGRLLDLVQDKELQLGHVRYLVLDEADKMLSMGFEPQIKQLKELLLPQPPAATHPASAKKKPKPTGRVQVSLFTATMPQSLEEVASGWLSNPERVHITTPAASISRSITQAVHVCAEHKKPAKLLRHLGKIREGATGRRQVPRVLVFVNKKTTARFVHKLVLDEGYRAALLHGERSQEEREAALADFRSGKAQVLVATDVAARGLHIRNLPFIINYDFPPRLDTFIHRVGRTGRLATDGHAFSFLTREMARLAPDLVHLLQQHGQQLDPNLVKLADAWQTAATKLGLLAEALGEEGEQQPRREDVLRQLGMKTQQGKKRERKHQRRHGAEEESAPPASSDSSGEDDDEAGGHAPAATDEGPPAPAFVPSRSFGGARPGYSFKKGPQGMGYYVDSVQQQATRKRAKPFPAGKKQREEELRLLKQKYSHAPIGGARGGAADSAQPPAGIPLLPGRLKELKRQRQQAAAAGQLPGFSSSDEEGGEGEAPAASPKRHKALPGRLRKKLAKQRGAGQ